MNTNHSVAAAPTGEQNISVSDERDLGAFIPSFLDDFGLDVYQFRVYCRLARRAGAGGQCWESINNIADKCRMNRKTVMNAIAFLLKFCLVRQTKRPGKSDVYQLTHHRHWISPTNFPQGSPTSSLEELVGEAMCPAAITHPQATFSGEASPEKLAPFEGVGAMATSEVDQEEKPVDISRSNVAEDIDTPQALPDTASDKGSLTPVDIEEIKRRTWEKLRSLSPNGGINRRKFHMGQFVRSRNLYG